MTSMLTITTIPAPAATVPAGMFQTTATARATKGKIIPADQRSRSVVHPQWEPTCEDKYKFHIVAALAAAAKDLLTEVWREQGDPKEIDSALLTEDALLAYAARTAESKRLSGDAITTWYAESAIRADMIAAGGEKQAAAVLARLQNLASPSPKYSLAQARAAIVALEGDADTDTGASLIAKLAKHIASLEAEMAKAEAKVTPF